jgi:hypothetical protein
MSVNKYIATNAATFVSAVLDTANVNIDYTTISIEQIAGTPGLGGDVLELSATLNIPANFTGNYAKSLIIEGNGVTLRPNTSAGFGTDVPLVRRNNGNTSDNKSCTLVFRNINFDCRSTSMTCVEIFNSSNVVFENCKFLNCKRGLVMANVNRANIKDCHVENVTSVGFTDTVDPAVSVNQINTRCNNITYSNCTVSCNITSASSVIGFFSYATAGLAFYECGTPTLMAYGIKYDSAGGNFSSPPNVINNIQIKDYTGFGAYDAMIYLYLTTGFAKVDGLYITGQGLNVSGGMVIVEANAYVMSGEPNPHLYVENLPWLPVNAIFKTQGGIPAGTNCAVTPLDDVVTWEFKEIYDGRNIFGAARWYQGLIPRHRYAEFFDESKIIIADSIFINNKYI